ncbi:LysR substrate-binding domain-containing protein [Undibacterium arcticum]
MAEHEVPKMVCSGEVDFGIGTESGNRLDLAAHLLSADAFVVVMRADHALARKRELRWQDLVDVPLIGPRQGNPIRERLDRALATEGIVLSRTHEAYLPLTMVGMVEAGLGIAVMSTAVTKLATGLGLVTRTLTNPVIKREVSLLFFMPTARCPLRRSASATPWSETNSRCLKTDSGRLPSCFKEIARTNAELSQPKKMDAELNPASILSLPGHHKSEVQV